MISPLKAGPTFLQMPKPHTSYATLSMWKSVFCHTRHVSTTTLVSIPNRRHSRTSCLFWLLRLDLDILVFMLLNLFKISSSDSIPIRVIKYWTELKIEMKQRNKKTAQALKRATIARCSQLLGEKLELKKKKKKVVSNLCQFFQIHTRLCFQI